MFQKSKVALVAFAHFSHDVFSALLAPILPLLIEKMGISLIQAGFLDIARKAPSLFNPLFGIIAQRSDAKWFVILTPSITAVSMGLLSVTNSYAIALFLLVIAGISAAFFHIPAPTIIKEFSGEKSGKGMSYFMAAGESARSIGPILAAGAISLWGLEGIWKLTPLGLTASFILYLKLKHYSPRFSAKRFSLKDANKELKNHSHFFVSLLSFIMLNYTSKFSVSLFLPLFLTQAGYGVEKASIAFGVLQGFGILGALFAGSYSDRFGRINVLILSSVGSAVSLLAFLLFYNDALWVMLAFLGFFLFSQSPVLLAGVHDLKTSNPTFINSIYMAMNFGVSSLIVYFAGFFGEKLGLFKTFEIASALTLLSVAALFGLRKYLK